MGRDQGGRPGWTPDRQHPGSRHRGQGYVPAKQLASTNYAGDWSGVNLFNKAGDRIWPICAFTYLHVRTSYTDPATAGVVRAFVEYMLSSAIQDKITDFYFYPLDPALSPLKSKAPSLPLHSAVAAPVWTWVDPSGASSPVQATGWAFTLSAISVKRTPITSAGSSRRTSPLSKRPSPPSKLNSRRRPRGQRRRRRRAHPRARRGFVRRRRHRRHRRLHRHVPWWSIFASYARRRHVVDDRVWTLFTRGFRALIFHSRRRPFRFRRGEEPTSRTARER